MIGLQVILFALLIGNYGLLLSLVHSNLYEGDKIQLRWDLIPYFFILRGVTAAIRKVIRKAIGNE